VAQLRSSHGLSIIANMILLHINNYWYLHRSLCTSIHLSSICSSYRHSYTTPFIPTIYLRILNISTCTVELQWSWLTGAASHPDTQQIRIIGFFSENRRNSEFEVRRLLLTVCIHVWTFLPRLIGSSRNHNTVLYWSDNLQFQDTFGLSNSREIYPKGQADLDNWR
jgi:hypothetical protein